MLENIPELGPAGPWRRMALVLAGDALMRKLSLQVLGAARTTDVYSYVYPPLPGGEEGKTGEVVVNVECAWRRGPCYQGPDAELARYVAHGYLHLAGWGDDTPRARARIRRRENRLLHRVMTGSVPGPFFRDPGIRDLARNARHGKAAPGERERP